MLDEYEKSGFRWELRDDRVLIRRIEEPTSISITDKPKGIKGIVLATGPGKWIPGEWWFLRSKKKWEWFPGHRQHPEVKHGMSVLFNSKWNDLRAGELVGTGSDLSGPLERPLSIHADPLLHLVSEADIFCIIPDLNVSASVGTGRVEQDFMQNTEIIGPWNGGDPNKGSYQVKHG